MAKTALVTGAYGFIGRHVARQLAREGLRVIGIGYRALDAIPAALTPETVERELTLYGVSKVAQLSRKGNRIHSFRIEIHRSFRRSITKG